MNPQSTVTTLNDALMCRLIAAAIRRVVLVSPGVSVPVAESLAAAWERLPVNSVSVILDIDPEVCRLGYGDEKSIHLLQAAASARGQTLCHEPGVRIGLLVVDDQTVVFSPTPLLIECSPIDSKPLHADELDFNAASGSPLAKPNAIFLGATPATLAAELGLDANDPAQRTLGLDPVNLSKLGALTADLAANPPLSFDVARYERVFNARIEFVELKVIGCSVSKHTASIPSDLMGLADPDADKRLRSSFKVIGAEDAVDEEGKLSEKSIDDQRKRIADEYLISLPRFGTVILRSNRPAFEKQIKELEENVKTFGEALKSRLHGIIESNIQKLATTLLPKVAQTPPKRWKRFLGDSPSPELCRRQLELDLRNAFGTADELIRDMNVSCLFKGVTYQTLTDPDFRKLVKEKIPTLELMQEYDAARAAENIG